MVRRIGLVVLALAALACGHGSVADERPAMVRTTFHVDGMHCEGCQATIVGALQRIDGVRSASADFKVGVVEAVHDVCAVRPETLRAAIEKLGYTVTAVTTVPDPGGDAPASGA